MNKEDKERIVKKIQKQYVEKESTEQEIDKLRKLDAQVKRPANIFAYAFGTVGSLVMGAGMCYAMEVIGNKKRVPGIVLGLAGMAMMGSTYPLYKKILATRKEQYAEQILELSNNIIEME